MLCLPHAQQLQVVKYLQAEADNLTSAFGESSNTWISKTVRLEVEALRNLARRLEEVHTASQYLDKQPSDLGGSQDETSQ